MLANELFRERKGDGISFGPVLAHFRTEPVIAEGNIAMFLPPLQNVWGFSDILLAGFGLLCCCFTPEFLSLR